MMHQKSGHHNMSRKKANMRKQEGVMMKKSNMNNKSKNKMRSNNKKRKNNNMNKRKQQNAAYKAKPAEQQQPMSFAERLMAMRQQVSGRKGYYVVKLFRGHGSLFNFGLGETTESHC